MNNKFCTEFDCCLHSIEVITLLWRKQTNNMSRIKYPVVDVIVEVDNRVGKGWGKTRKHKICRRFMPASRVNATWTLAHMWHCRRTCRAPVRWGVNEYYVVRNTLPHCNSMFEGNHSPFKLCSFSHILVREFMWVSMKTCKSLVAQRVTNIFSCVTHINY